MRDDKGRFLQGNDGGPGRPSRATEGEYLAALTDICSLDRWRKIVLRAVKDAEKGNGYARQWLSEYIVGKPATTINLRAGEQALLNDILEKMKAQGIAASDVFQAMLTELATAERTPSDGSE